MRKNSTTKLLSTRPTQHDGPSPSNAFKKPTIVADRYTLTEELGSGAMGTVYRAYDQVLDDWVALKLLKTFHDAHHVGLIKREVKLARRVAHKNVARIFELGFHNGGPFITMELIEGESLARPLARGEFFSVRRICRMLEGVALGLQAVHEASILHGDVKPANIMRTEQYRFVLTDFGVAHALVEIPQNHAIGTPLYMAPESSRGAPRCPSMDVYALGVTAYRLLTGRRPFDAEDIPALIKQKDRGPLRHLDDRTDLPPPLIELIYKCMSPVASNRPTTKEITQVSVAMAERASESTDLPFVPTSRSRPRHRPPRTRIAVLPPTCPKDVSHAWVHGFARRMFDTLARTQGLQVIAPSVFAFAPIPPASVDWTITSDFMLDVSTGLWTADFKLVKPSDERPAWKHRVSLHPGQALVVIDEIARAVLTILQIPPPSDEAPSMTRDAVDLFMQAQALHGAIYPEASQKAVALLEQALGYAPDNPMLTAGLARALVRDWYFRPTTTAPFEKARTAAEHAVAAAPDRGESHLALACVSLHGGDPVEAARAYRQAMLRSPSLAEAHEGLGRLLLETFHPTEAQQKFQTVYHLQPGNPIIQFELLRWAALRRDWAEYEARWKRMPEDRRIIYPISKVRHYLWRRDSRALKTAMDELKPMIPDELFDECEKLAVVMEVISGRAPIEKAIGILENEARSAGNSRRRRSLALQLKAEVLCHFEKFDAALAATHESMHNGLCDLAWLELCGLWDPIRGTPAFEHARQLLRDRAQAVYNTLFD